MRAAAVLCALTGALAALPVHAMTLPAGSASVLSHGTRIRWSLPDSGGVHVGKVVALSSDTLAVTNERGRQALAVTEIASLDISTPTNQTMNYAWKGSLVGAGICVGTVAIVDFAKAKGTTDVLDVESEEGHADASAYVTAALIGVGLGAVIGGMMGAKKPGPERWKPIQAMAGVSMLDGGVPVASVAIRF